MNNFLQRALTGVVFVSVVCALTILSEYSFLLLLLLIAFGGMLEFYRIVLRRKLHAAEYLLLLAGSALTARQYWLPEWLQWHALGVLFSLMAIAVLFSRERSWQNLVWYAGGIFYIALPLSLFDVSVFRLVFDTAHYDYRLALNLFILIWSSDTFAYLSGKAFGKHKLSVKVSPGKTWEGLAGAVLLTLALSYYLSGLFAIPVALNMGIAFLTVLSGTLGDLIQSMLKRTYQIKDSGNILPGHGGVLDRFDALLISLPFTSISYHLFL